jgi:hypothetical protein
MYKTFTGIEGDLDAMTKNIDLCSAPKAMQALNNSIGKVNSMIGMVKTMGSKDMFNGLKNPLDAVTSTIENFKSNIENAIGPNGPIGSAISDAKKFGRDVKALVKSAERMLGGRKVKPEVVTALDNRITSVADTIMSKVDGFKTLINTFVPTITADVKAFMASLGSVAPAAKDNILAGKAKDYAKTLQSSDYITKTGAAARNLAKAAKEFPGMTREVAGKLGVITSFLEGNAFRQVVGLYLSNIATQRGQMEKELNMFATEVIGSMENLVAVLERDIHDITKIFT